MQIHEHRLLKFCLAVVDCNRVVMTVQTMDKGLNGRFVDVANVRRCLTGFSTRDNGVRVDQSEGVDYDFALDGLNGVNYDGD